MFVEEFSHVREEENVPGRDGVSDVTYGSERLSVQKSLNRKTQSATSE